MAFTHNILNAGDNSHNGTGRKQRKSLSMVLNDPRREAGMPRAVWVEMPPTTTQEDKDKQSSLFTPAWEKRGPTGSGPERERAPQTDPGECRTGKCFHCRYPWHHCAQKPGWWWDGSRSCIEVETGNRKILWDDSSELWGRTHYPPVACPWVDSMAKSHSSNHKWMYLTSTLNTGFVIGYRAPGY